jgi:hypothetical protein
VGLALGVTQRRRPLGKLLAVLVYEFHGCLSPS